MHQSLVESVSLDMGPQSPYQPHADVQSLCPWEWRRSYDVIPHQHLELVLVHFIFLNHTLTRNDDLRHSVTRRDSWGRMREGWGWRERKDRSAPLSKYRSCVVLRGDTSLLRRKVKQRAIDWPPDAPSSLYQSSLFFTVLLLSAVDFCSQYFFRFIWNSQSIGSKKPD